MTPGYDIQNYPDEPDDPEFSDDNVTQKFNRFYMLKNLAIRKMALNDSALFALIGNRRTGKSTTSIVLLYAIDPDPTLDQICFSFKDLQYFFTTKTGKPIVWEEAGTSAFNRDALTRENKLLVKHFNLFGYKRIPVIANVQNMNMLDSQVIPQVDSILRFRSFDKTSNGTHYTQKAYEEFEVYNDHFGHMYYNPVRDLLAGDRQKSRVGLIPLPSEEWLFKKFGVKNSFMNQYQKLKDEYFESLDDAEEQEQEKYTNRDIAKLERQNKAGNELMYNLKLQKGFTNKEISALSGIPISTIQSWGFFNRPGKNGDEQILA